MVGSLLPLAGQAGLSLAATTAARTYGGMALKAVSTMFVNRRTFTALSKPRTFNNRPTGLALINARNYVSPKILEKLVLDSPFGMSELLTLEKRFARIAGADENAQNIELNLEQFKEAMATVGITNPTRCEEYFKMLDYNHDGKVDFRELVSGFGVLLRGSVDDWAKMEFKVWDTDHNGFIDKTEFRRYIRATHEGHLSAESLNYLADEMFDNLNTAGDKLDFEEFKQGILRSQMVLPRFHQSKIDKASGRLSMGERLVIDLIGERFQVPAGQSPEASPKNSHVYMLDKGDGILKHGDMVVSHLTSEKPAEAFWSLSAMFIETPPAFKMEAVNDCQVLKIHRDDLASLALNNHPGATKLLERFGSLMHERSNQVRERILKLQKEGHQLNQEQLNFLARYNELVRIYALKYHAFGRHGKIEIAPTRDLGSKNSLSIAYSPGVAEPCLAIKDDLDMSYEYTSRGHLVGVVSNGTAVLGLGDIGPEAAKPVMEGKAVLFKKFGGVDAFDVEIREKDPDRLIDIVCSLEPTFGGINLEDIKAPECFRIERTCQERCNIPIFHDDQHGTAIIAAAGLVNALEFAHKDIRDIRVVVNGAGAAGYTCAKLFIHLGVKPQNVICLDKDGVVYKGRPDLVADPDLYLHDVAIDTPARTLADVMPDTDVFAGLSVPNVLTPEMLKSMRKSPLVFALSNPVPEIDYQLAMRTRSDVIMGTGRSDLPNQINNVCAFPFIFRGALDCRARKVNMEMKVAAVHAIADLAKQSPNYGPQQIIPSPLDPRLLYTVAPAVLKAAIDSGVARLNVDVDEYRAKLMEEANKSK